MNISDQQLEALDVLDGTRNRRAKAQAAVRIADLAPLLQIRQPQAAKAAGAAPTQAEYDALLADVLAMHARLTEISQILTQRLL